jgi:hypothetical protein
VVVADGRETQDASRSANARFRGVALASAWGSDESVIPFLCECADDACVGRIDMTIGDYFAAQDGIRQYVVLRDHAVIAGEFVVEDRGTFLVMGKAAG